MKSKTLRWSTYLLVFVSVSFIWLVAFSPGYRLFDFIFGFGIGAFITLKVALMYHNDNTVGPLD